MNETNTSTARKGISRRNLLIGAAAATGAALLGTGCTSQNSAASAAPSAESVAGCGTGAGRNGELSVRAIFENDRIADIQIVRSHETKCVGACAQDLLKDLIISNQTLNVDAVSGATLTSMAYLAAVKDAFEAAGQNRKEWEGREHASLSRDEPVPASTDVIVVGSGGAGLCAAVTAASEGKSVLVLEKLAVIGGSTSLSGAGYAAPGCWPQVQAGIEDSPELMAQDMLIGGDNEGDPELVTTLCNSALDCFNWLSYEVSVPWIPGVVQDGGHSVARSLNPVDYGAGLVEKLTAYAEALGVTLCSSAQVDELTTASGAVTGVKATDLTTGTPFTVAAGAVVLATGGFGRNVDMRTKYNPEFDDSYLCTDAVGATGDGIRMAEAIGAQLADMEFIQTHPTGNPVGGAMLDVGGIRVAGCSIMVNLEGERFVEELERRDVVSKATLAQTGGMGYFVLARADAEDQGLYDWAADEIDSMTASGIWVEGDTLEAACEPLGIDAAALAQSIETWNADCETGVDSQFAYRAEMFPIANGPYCIFACTPTVHYTMGGVLINADAAVLDAAGAPIPGLFAAGETTGNIMGTNRLGTTAVVDIVAFGRIAGTSAAAFA